MTDKKEYIERGALEEKLNHTLNQLESAYGSFNRYVYGFEKAVDIVKVESVAADVVEVVRCEKCLFNGYVQSDGVIHCARESVMGTGTVFRKATDYCSYGEKKDDADNG